MEAEIVRPITSVSGSGLLLNALLSIQRFRCQQLVYKSAGYLIFDLQLTRSNTATHTRGEHGEAKGRGPYTLISEAFLSFSP